jgi:hypothetical protein
MIWGGFDVVLPDYNDQQGCYALVTDTLAPICCCSCRAENNLEHASKSKNKQQQVDKQTARRPCPRDEICHHEFGVLDTSSRVVWIDTRVARK